MDVEQFRGAVLQQLDKLDSLMPLMSALDIKVLLVLHTPPGGFASKGQWPQFKIFSDVALQDALVNLWQEITVRYLGNSQFLGFELLSEPATGSGRVSPIWVNLAIRTSQAVLNLDPARKIYLPPDYANGKHFKTFWKRVSKGLGKVAMRESVILVGHYFLPAAYVNQGIYNSKNIKYPSKSLRNNVKKSLLRFKKSARAVRSPILIGEFSAARWAPGADLFLRDVVKFFERAKFDWMYHTFRGGDWRRPWSLENSSVKEDLAPVSSEQPRLTVLKRFYRKN
jgi:hypothetical protein